MRDLVQRGVKHVWHPDEEFAMAYVHALSGGQILRSYLEGLDPQNDKERAAKADALGAAAMMQQTRLQMTLGLVDPVSYPLLGLVVLWAMGLFFGFGFLSKTTATSYAMAALGALAVASSIYAIDDLSGPYEGVFA